MDTAKLTSKSQITVPRKIRETLRVGQGDRLVFEPTADGKFTVAKAAALRKSDGAARRRLGNLPPTKIKDLGDTLSSVVREDNERIRNRP